MQIFIGIVINIVILTLTLIVFYIYIAYKLREKIETEAIQRVKDELESLVVEFNHSALVNITLLEDAIERAENAIKNENPKNKKQIEPIKSVYKSRDERLEEYNQKTNTDISLEEEKRVRLISDEYLEDSLKEVYISESIKTLYKNGYSKSEIAENLEISLTDVDNAISK